MIIFSDQILQFMAEDVIKVLMTKKDEFHLIMIHTGVCQ